MSGFTGDYSVQELLQRGACRFFAKPFPVEEMLQDVWQLAREPDLRRSA